MLQAQPRHAGTDHRLLGLLAFQGGKHDLAVEYVGQAARLDVFSAPYAADLGEILHSLNRIPEAIESYQRALKINPEMVNVQYQLGTFASDSRRTGSGAERYQQQR